ncbi:MAG TPA: FMN-binding protein [Chitinispirillaceae bacterium]|nr:FMN-binding protein [Chitinispirillaceae bacterium]
MNKSPILIICCLLVSCSHYYTLKTSQEIYAKTSFDKIDINRVKNGTYFGYYDMLLVNAMVKATVNDGKLTGLELLEHRFSHSYNGSAVIEQILQKQSLQIDGVSGATYSWKSIVKATERALKTGLE